MSTRDAAIRKNIGLDLGKPLSDAEFNFLKDNSWVEDYDRVASGSIPGIREALEGRARAMEARREQRGTVRPLGHGEERRDVHSVKLAAQLEAVTRVRTKIWSPSGGPLTTGQGVRWLVDNFEADALPEHWRAIDLLQPRWYAESFGDPEVVGQPKIKAYPINALFLTCRALIQQFPWSIADATLFVMCDHTPITQVLRTTLNKYSDTTIITLTIGDWSVTPTDIANRYSEERTRIRESGKDARATPSMKSKKHKRTEVLLRFVQERETTGQPLREIFDAWQHEHLTLRYGCDRAFYNAVANARKSQAF